MKPLTRLCGTHLLLRVIASLPHVWRRAYPLESRIFQVAFRRTGCHKALRAVMVSVTGCFVYAELTFAATSPKRPVFAALARNVKLYRVRLKREAWRAKTQRAHNGSDRVVSLTELKLQERRCLRRLYVSQDWKSRPAFSMRRMGNSPQTSERQQQLNLATKGWNLAAPKKMALALAQKAPLLPYENKLSWT